MTAKELQLINSAHFLTTNPWVLALIIPVVIWTLIWKGIALWKASQNNQIAWFVILLAVNTVGILEIIYIFFFSKKKAQQ